MYTGNMGRYCGLEHIIQTVILFFFEQISVGTRR